MQWNRFEPLQNLLIETKDGEWGSDKPSENTIEMAVIRGTDFEAVTYGDLSRVPRRFIPTHIGSRKMLRAGDLLIETAGGTKDQPTGRLLLIKQRLIDASDKPLICASFSRFMRPNDKIVNPEYLYWYLQWLYKSGGMNGYHVQHTGVARFQYTDFSTSTQIPLPNLSIQNQIASSLSNFNDKIEINKQIYARLEEMVRAIFQSWFVNFDPVRAKIKAKAEGHNPERAAMAMISGKSEIKLDSLPNEILRSLAATASLFPEELEDSKVGKIPIGWKLSDLSEFCTLNSRSWSDKTLPSQISYVDLANAKEGEIIAVQDYARETAPTRARRILDPNDIIIGTVRPGNRSFALIGRSEKQLTGSTGFAVLTPKSAEFREFAYLIATNNKSIEHLAHIADGGAYPAVRPDSVLALCIVSPPLRVITSFHMIVKPFFDKILEIRNENKCLIDMRDTLLPKLMSGELPISMNFAEFTNA